MPQVYNCHALYVPLVGLQVCGPSCRPSETLRPSWSHWALRVPDRGPGSPSLPPVSVAAPKADGQITEHPCAAIDLGLWWSLALFPTWGEALVGQRSVIRNCCSFSCARHNQRWVAIAIYSSVGMMAENLGWRWKSFYTVSSLANSFWCCEALELCWLIGLSVGDRNFASTCSYTRF